MRLAIVGCRHFVDYELFTKCIESLGIIDSVECIVSGGATGADSLAERYAHEHGIPIKIYPADWSKYGKSAGYRRNKLIVDDATYVVAFWDYKSRGTKLTIDLARDAHIKGKIFRI